MRNKTVPLLIACVCGTIAAIGLSQWMQAQSTGDMRAKTVEIFVTSKTIDIAEQITPDKIRLEQWPADRVPKGASGALDDLEGKFARQRFYEGEPVLPIKLMDDSSGSSQTIPVGYSVVAMRADPETSVATLIRPGDRVDVVAYFTKSELIPETMAKTVLKGVRVFAVDGRTERENNEDGKDIKPPRSISLLIDKHDTPAWTYASELGKIRLTLGNPTDISEASQDGEGSGAGQEFLTWLSDYQIAQSQSEVEAKRPVSKTIAPAAPAPVVNQQKQGFKMLKMSGGVLTEYWIEEGKRVPTILNESGPNGIKEKRQPTASQSQPAANPPSVQSDYSDLNGPQSPFFQASNETDDQRPRGE